MLGRVHDIGVGEQEVVAVGGAHSFGDGPHLSGPTGGQRARGDHAQLRCGFAGRGARCRPGWRRPPGSCGIRRGSAGLRARRQLRPTTSASLRAGTTAVTEGAGVRRATGGSVGAHAPEAAARQQEVEPDGERGGGGEGQEHSDRIIAWIVLTYDWGCGRRWDSGPIRAGPRWWRWRERWMRCGCWSGGGS